MSGHNTICVATALVECGLLPADRRERFVLEAPSGPVPIRTELAADGRCASVTFDGPPSFVAVRDEVVQLDPDACRAIGLAAALQVNGALQVVNLRFNEIGDAGATALSKALLSNRSIVELHLGGNLVAVSYTHLTLPTIYSV